MPKVVITPDGRGYDVSVYVDGAKVQTAWAYNESQANEKANIMADYYRDENGQRADIARVL